jgi:ABC-type bacteriocin/lantibiotic exporter with double-glycine peptidase domain
MVLAYHGVEKSEEELSELLETDFTGTVAGHVHRVTQFGFLTVLHQATWEDLRHYLEIGLPCITLVYTIHFPHPVDRAGRHAVVVVGLDEETVYLHDPLEDSGPTAVPRVSFDAAWQARRYRLILIVPLQR